MAKIKNGLLQDPNMQALLPTVSRALKTDSALRSLRNAAVKALQKAQGVTYSEAYVEVDQSLFTSKDDVSAAREILNDILRDMARQSSREATQFADVGTEGNEDQAPGAMIAVEATERSSAAYAASIFGDMSNEAVADAYEDLFGVSPF